MSDVDVELLEDVKPDDTPVEIDLETGEEIEAKADGAKPEAEEEEPGIVALRKQLEEARRNTEAERRRREEAEASRVAEAQNRVRAEKAVLGSQHEAIQAQIAALDRDAELAERALAEAIEKNDPAAVAKVNRIMIRIEAERAKAENYRDQVVAAQDRPVVTEGPVRAAPKDPVEAAAAAASPQSAEWIRAHSEIVTDPSKAKLAQRGHYKAMGEGIEPDTPEYFAFLDRHMGYVQDNPEPAKPEPVKRPAVAAAPPTSVPSSGQAGQRTMRLSREQQETARDLGMSLQEYAKYALEIAREGGK